MSDYIKREDAIDACLEETSTKWSTKEEAEEGRIIANVIKSLPSADVMPVRHGRWIRTGQSYINPNKFLCLTCSCCLSDLDEHIRKEPCYCPYCGARMDGGNNE